MDTIITLTTGTTIDLAILVRIACSAYPLFKSDKGQDLFDLFGLTDAEKEELTEYIMTTTQEGKQNATEKG